MFLAWDGLQPPRPSTRKTLSKVVLQRAFPPLFYQQEFSSTTRLTKKLLNKFSHLDDITITPPNHERHTRSQHHHIYHPDPWSLHQHHLESPRCTIVPRAPIIVPSASHREKSPGTVPSLSAFRRDSCSGMAIGDHWHGKKCVHCEWLRSGRSGLRRCSSGGTGR